MARLPRYFVPHVPMHIIVRGNNRQRIYADGSDYRYFREVLHNAASRHRLAIHAYVLMPNHVHLLATPVREQSTARTLQSVGRRYVWRFNERHERTGTLWEGRYRATLVDSEAYLLVCSRYIELNPVRAGLAARPDDYAWSSYGCNAEGKVDGLLTAHPVYEGLGLTQFDRREAYRALFDEVPSKEVVDEIRSSTHKGWALGNDEFRRRVENIGRRRPAPLPSGRKKRSVNGNSSASTAALTGELIDVSSSPGVLSPEGADPLQGS